MRLGKLQGEVVRCAPKWGQFDNSTRSSPGNREACSIHEVQPRVATVASGLLLGPNCYPGPSWVVQTLILMYTSFCLDCFSILKNTRVPILLNIWSYLAICCCIPSLPSPYRPHLYSFFGLSLHFWVFLEMSSASPT